MYYKFTEPLLLVDDHHGVYCGQFAYQWLADYLKDQVNAKLSSEDIKAIEAGPDHEWHHEAVDNMTNLILTDRDGVDFYIMFAEGGVWCIPVSFLEDEEKSSQFFGY